MTRNQVMVMAVVKVVLLAVAIGVVFSVYGGDSPDAGAAIERTVQ